MEAKETALNLIQSVKESVTDDISDKTALEIAVNISNVVIVQNNLMHKEGWIDESYKSGFRKHFEYWKDIKKELENLNPACPSCNIQKKSYSLEQFRENIKKFVGSLNKYSTQYKFAKKYGLIEETEIEVKFYFEK